MPGLVATAEIEIAASPASVWDALTDPNKIKQYFMGSTVDTNWQPGSSITWSGEYNGKPYRDKGNVIEVAPEKRLVLTHFSPLSGQPDTAENYHTLTYQLAKTDEGTHLSLSQDNNSTQGEVKHSQANWQAMLEALKKLVEQRPSPE